MENNEKNNSVKTEQQIKRNNNPRKKRIVKKTKENKAEVKNINQEVKKERTIKENALWFLASGTLCHFPSAPL